MGYVSNYFKLLEDFEDDISISDQKYSSANTSINSSKLPTIFSLVDFKPNTINLDYGGGKFDNAVEFLAQKDVKNLIFDPYNRSSAHNQEVLKEIRDNGGADTATLSNVLNVIQEKEILTKWFALTQTTKNIVNFLMLLSRYIHWLLEIIKRCLHF